MKLHNIIILTSEFPPQPGGIGTHAYNLAKEFSRKEFLVKIICDTRSASGEEEKLFDASLNFEVKRITRKKVMFLSYLKRIQTAFKYTGKADVIICTGKFPLWLGALLSIFFNRNFVAVVHGSELLLPNPLLRNLTNISLGKFDLVVAVSRYTKSLLDEVELKKIVVINNGINFPPDLCLTRKNSLKPMLLTVGNVTRRKGQHNVINALPVLLKSYPQLEYHIVGIPTEREKLENLSMHLDVQNKVKFYGSVSEQEKLDILQETDIFIMLSEATEEGDVEGFGIAILEANALGIPAIGARGSGIEDAIKEGYSGFLVNKDNDKEISISISEILENYKMYSENARGWAAGFSWNLVIDKYLKYIFGK